TVFNQEKSMNHFPTVLRFRRCVLPISILLLSLPLVASFADNKGGAPAQNSAPPVVGRIPDLGSVSEVTKLIKKLKAEEKAKEEAGENKKSKPEPATEGTRQEERKNHESPCQKPQRRGRGGLAGGSPILYQA